MGQGLHGWTFMLKVGQHSACVSVRNLGLDGLWRVAELS